MIKEYLDKLGLDEYASVAELMRAHLDVFSFSGASVILGEDVSLDMEDIYRKIVVEGRGGYCFEHNKLFYEVLKNLGYKVTPYLARVVRNQDKEAPLTHRIAVLEDDKEKYLVDVGFGAIAPVIPVNMAGSLVDSHMGNRYRIFDYGDGSYSLQWEQEEDFYTIYKFDLNHYQTPDFELGNFYSCKHPKATFVNNLVMARISDGEIFSLINHVYSVRSESGAKEFEIESADELFKILNDVFKCNVSLAESERLYQFVKAKRSAS